MSNTAQADTGALTQEAALRSIGQTWQRLTGSPPTPGVSFEQAGGDSLGLLEIIFDLERLSGRKLKLSFEDFHSGMTAWDLAARVVTRPAAAEIGAGQQESPVFLCPALHGDAPNLAAFRRSCGAHIRFVVIEYGGDWRDCIASGYGLQTLIDVVRAHIGRDMASGPIRIAGFSNGSTVAFEAAMALEADGFAVESLSILDTGPPGAPGPDMHLAWAPPDRLRAWWWTLLSLHRARREKKLNVRLGRIVASLMRMKPVKPVLRLVAKTVLAKAPTRSSAKENLVNLFDWANFYFTELARVAACDRAVPYNRRVGRKLQAPVVLFHSQRPKKTAAADYNWSSVAEHVTVVPIPGDHYNILTEHVAATAAAFVAAQTVRHAAPAATPGPVAIAPAYPAWLPVVPDWAARIDLLNDAMPPAASWAALVALADARLDASMIAQIDRCRESLHGAAPPAWLQTQPIRLAVLGSSTLAHLLPAIRVTALRQGIWLTTYETDYGQYLQEMSDASSGLHRFAPNAVLFAFDTPHLLRGVTADMDKASADAAFDEILRGLTDCWQSIHHAFRCPVIQQTALPVFPKLLGSNEHRLPGSRHHMVSRLNAALRDLADRHSVDLLAVDDRAALDGIGHWYDAGLWHHAKMQIAPSAAPIYGDMLARLLAAGQGRARKCLIIDLDNTIWGGTIGDDGLEGIVLGQGSAQGEAFAAFQSYVAELGRRGVILAVCSKNNEADAMAAFTQHPDMVLTRADIACFVANWDDKATNIRAIAAQLNIGLDSVVFFDDSPFERSLVRQELPMVAVPEVGEDPSLFAALLADAGYFESLAITREDRERSVMYQAAYARAQDDRATDLPRYLRGLEMKLQWRRFDLGGLQRIVQLINKTNQFNLTARRYTEAEIRAVMDDPRAFGLQFRLLDRFGDNGVIAIVIGRLNDGQDCILDTWLMSCRVLGRGVEDASLAVIVEQARSLGAQRLIGEYRPTPRNAMVAGHYQRLGFQQDAAAQTWALDIADFVAPALSIDISTAGAT